MSQCKHRKKCSNYDAWGYNCTYWQPDELDCYREKKKDDKRKD